jgi:hypothetical protein
VLAVIAALIVASAVVWAAMELRGEVRRLSAEAERARTLQLLSLFAPGIMAVQNDPRMLLVWQPLARAGRALCTPEFEAIDRARGSPFPFAPEVVQNAHARWTADWLSWERAHDAEFKRRAADAAESREGGEASIRRRLDAIEHEKLDLYQRRYEEYVRVSKALQALM